VKNTRALTGGYLNRDLTPRPCRASLRWMNFVATFHLKAFCLSICGMNFYAAAVKKMKEAYEVGTWVCRALHRRRSRCGGLRITGGPALTSTLLMRVFVLSLQPHLSHLLQRRLALILGAMRFNMLQKFRKRNGLCGCCRLDLAARRSQPFPLSLEISLS